MPALPTGSSAPEASGETTFRDESKKSALLSQTNVVLPNLYSRWKSRFLRVAGDSDHLRVIRPESGDDAVSEGFGYGMLIAVAMDDSPTFRGLWNEARRYHNARRLMHWRIDSGGKVIGENSATDAEEDMAYALILADKKWGRFDRDATDLINAILTHEVETGTFMLKPGDVWGGSDGTNPSYFAPAYLRVFQSMSDRSGWTEIIDRGYALLTLSSDSAATGLVPDWCDAEGKNVPSFGHDYSYDAVRTPLRLAMDLRWNGDTRARIILEKMDRFWAGVGALSIVDGYKLDGSPIGRYHNAAFVATAAAGSASLEASTVGLDLWEETLRLPEENYYNDTLKLLCLIFLAGRLNSEPGC